MKSFYRLSRGLFLLLLCLFVCIGFFSQSVFAQAIPRDFTFTLPLFSNDSPWNQRADTVATLSGSDQQILTLYRVLRGDTTNLFPAHNPPTSTWPFIDVPYDEFSNPIFKSGSSTTKIVPCDYEGLKSWQNPKLPENNDGTVTVASPAGQIRPAGPQGTDSDGHLILFNPDTSISYDFWQATTSRNGECQSLGGGIAGTDLLEAGFADLFDINKNGVNTDSYSSATATGTPLLAGLLLPEDVKSGVIAHALGLIIPGPRNLAADPEEPLSTDYYSPASTTEAQFYSANPYALAAGQRLRLKKTIVDDGGDLIDENDLAPITVMFLTALRNYGAYVVDNGNGFTIKAEDYHSALFSVSDDEMNRLIGQPLGASLPAGKTKWQIVMDQLTSDLESIPFAYGPWTEGQTPSTATITQANFEVIEPFSTSSGSASPTASISASQSGSIVTLALSLDPGSHVGTTADWWLVQMPPTGSLRSFDIATMGFKDGLKSTIQMALTSNWSVTVPISGLSSGSHVFYFGVDRTNDGSLSIDTLSYDSSTLTIGSN